MVAMTDLAELQIDLMQRAMLLERSARLLLNGRGKVKDLKADLRAATDAFAHAREALRTAGAAGGHVVQEPPPPAFDIEEATPPCFEITP
jgi:hypothetical protein